ncbi:hypothetical protein IAQ61_001656 [Plenodomus lingam]|uniref:Uncharacterized protein n=1 Tax=Leptosphaeria maculans (strain JN3 / isolate v23.1.3 / race Av1-4-5-6-7-8) TaxID=985895 RepID=M1ZJF1_LEPMJ|nr:hypothetical protein IAQ61_001656 [Plenodomus lingam]CCT61100.1 predicted protein [Plenodomus lingam JN3]
MSLCPDSIRQIELYFKVYVPGFIQIDNTLSLFETFFTISVNIPVPSSNNHHQYSTQPFQNFLHFDHRKLTLITHFCLIKTPKQAMTSYQQRNDITSSEPVLPAQGSMDPMDSGVIEGQRHYRLMTESAKRLSPVYAGRNTYTAQQPGDLARAVGKLHGANPDISFKCTLRHLTFNDKPGRIFESGLLEELVIDIDNVGTEDEIKTAMEAFGESSAL